MAEVCVVDNPRLVPVILASGKNPNFSRRLLIVEDDPRLAQVLQRGLIEKGLEVSLAGTGPLGIEIALSSQPDLILLDLMLPGMDGFSVLKDLRSGGFDRPVILMTGRMQADDASRGRELGANDFLHKPFQFQELLARLHFHLRGSPLESSGPLRVGNLELDAAQHRVQREGKPLELTLVEFNLLEYFMQYSGLRLTRSMIQVQLWGHAHSGQIQLVDVYVDRLKSKIEIGDSPALIHSAREGGFVFEEKG